MITAVAATQSPLDAKRAAVAEDPMCNQVVYRMCGALLLHNLAMVPVQVRLVRCRARPWRKGSVSPYQVVKGDLRQGSALAEERS